MCIISVYVLCIICCLYILNLPEGREREEEDIFVYVLAYIMCVCLRICVYAYIGVHSGTAEKEMGRYDAPSSEVSQIEERRYCRQKQMEN